MPNWCDNNLTIYGTNEKIKEIEGVVKAFSNFCYQETPQGEKIKGYDLTGQKIRRKLNGDPMGLLYYCKPEPDYKTTPVAKTFPELNAKYASTEEERKKALENKPTIRENSWYDWRLQNWGCKWEVEAQLGDVDEGQIFLFFMSPWGPPLDAYAALLEHEGITGIEANYYEPGCDFAGCFVNGEDTCFAVSELTPEDFEDEVVKELDECFYLYSEIMQSNPLQLRPEFEPVLKGMGIEDDFWEVDMGIVEKIYEALKDKQIPADSISIIKKENKIWPTHFVFKDTEYALYPNGIDHIPSAPV